MSAAPAHKPIVHYVGSIPLPDAETVFRTLAAATGPHLQFPAYKSRAHARERQVFGARAESPNARRRDKRADRPFAKIKELFTKIMRLS